MAQLATASTVLQVTSSCGKHATMINSSSSVRQATQSNENNRVDDHRSRNTCKDGKLLPQVLDKSKQLNEKGRSKLEVV